jgi:exopolyphosphatase/guanosine-5'-triphosphate,3'-diphosphate pyrophosphatase
MGCIATTRRFFADGKLSKKRWKEARTEITAEFQQFASAYRYLGWQEGLRARRAPSRRSATSRRR